MTQWVDKPTGGRERGPQALVRAWVAVLVRPRRFFRTGIAPGDQAPGLVFAVAVTLLEVGTRLAVAPGAAPAITADPALSAVLVLVLVGLLVAPAVLHLTAAVQTVLLMAAVPERAGVSETVQVIGYAVAPCAFAGLPIPAVRAACAVYGAALLAVGIAEVHGTTLPRAVAVSFLPSALVFGYGFRGFGALVAVFSQLSDVLPI